MSVATPASLTFDDNISFYFGVSFHCYISVRGMDVSFYRGALKLNSAVNRGDTAIDMHSGPTSYLPVYRFNIAVDFYVISDSEFSVYGLQILYF